MLHEMFDLFRSGEPVPYVILAFFCVGWIIILERVFVLHFVYRVNFKKFNVSIKKMLAAGDLERARSYCEATSKTGLPLICCKAIDAYQSDTFKVRMTVSEEAMSFMPRIRRRISQIPNMATSVVLLGAVATVYGIWESFRISAGLEMGMKSFTFASGLGDSLSPLALSLMTALCLMLPYGVLDAVASRLEGEIEHSLTIVLNVLAPETQTVVAAQPMVSGGGFSSDVAISEEHKPVSSDLSTAHGKGIDDDVSLSANAKIPDEEEII